MPPQITASMLYDYVACPHRVTMDQFGDPAQRDEVSPFIRLLWERGAVHEQAIIGGLVQPFTDLSHYSGDEKERMTSEAIARGDQLIYGGRIAADDLLGDPDLLCREGNGYVAGDIKSGAAEEGREDLSKPKVHYGVQVALYTDILERKGIASGRRAFIWDADGNEGMYDLRAPIGPRTPESLWDEYQLALAEVRDILREAVRTRGASSSTCKLCHWYSACQRELESLDDLTLIPELGRSRRDVMVERIPTLSDLADINPAAFTRGAKTVFKGIGPDMLRKFHERARLVKSPDPRPYLREPLGLPASDLELFFDVEVDPMRDICYLHGFVERRNQDNGMERYVAFFAEDTTNEAEQQAFSRAWAYVRASTPCAVYYYSKYERTTWRKLREKYPDVCTESELEAFFDPSFSIDLYHDVVQKKTEWPTRDHSIKTLAKYLGFAWRDTNPSGAASIEWFDRWVTERDPAIRQRILDYNEDDCRATRVLLDGLRAL